MNRRSFTKKAVLTTIATSLPFCLFAKGMLPPIDEVELIGKGNPTLSKGIDYQVRPKVAIAFKAMKAKALEDGIQIKVVSSYRDYNHQNRIWEHKFKRFRESGLSPIQSIKKIIEYSTIPGTSRHHWGTDLDLIDGAKQVTGDVLVPSKFHGTGPFCKFKEWMDIHAQSFGFYLVYTDVPNRKGFNYEPWHYSYKALSKGYLDLYRELDIKSILQKNELVGSDSFSDEFITAYITENILDINPDLLT